MALMPRLDAGARMLGVKTAVDVRAGTAISIEIVAPTLRVKQGSDTIVWRGEPANAAFHLTVPEGAQQ